MSQNRFNEISLVETILSQYFSYTPYKDRETIVYPNFMEAGYER